MNIRQFNWLFFLAGYALIAYGVFLSGISVYESPQGPAIILGSVIVGLTFILLSGVAATHIGSKLSDKTAIFLFVGLVTILIGLIGICAPLTSNHVYLGVLSVGNLALAILALSLFGMCHERAKLHSVESRG